MILGDDDGPKLSKRHGAVSVMQYDEDGYLPEAVVRGRHTWDGHTVMTRYLPSSNSAPGSI